MILVTGGAGLLGNVLIKKLLDKTMKDAVESIFTDPASKLYNDILKIDPLQPDNETRDRFLLSKGHACTSLYATLGLKGFFDLNDAAAGILGQGNVGLFLMPNQIAVAWQCT